MATGTTGLSQQVRDQFREGFAELHTALSQRHASNLPAIAVHRYARNPDGTYTRDQNPSRYGEIFLYGVNATTTEPVLAYGAPGSGKTSLIQDFNVYAGVPRDAVMAATISGHEELNVASALHEIITTKTRNVEGLSGRLRNLLHGAKIEELERATAVAKPIGRMQIYEEAGRLPRASQEYLLRALEEGVFEAPWGGGEPMIITQPRRLYLTTNTGIGSIQQREQFRPAFLDRVGMSIPHSTIHGGDGTRKIIQEADRKLGGGNAGGYLTFGKVPAAKEFLRGKSVNGGPIDVDAIPEGEEPLYVMLAARMAATEVPLSEDAKNFAMYAPAVLSVCHRGGEDLIGEKTQNNRRIPDRCEGCEYNVNNSSICQYTENAVGPRSSISLKQSTQGGAELLDLPKEGTLGMAVELFPYIVGHRLLLTPAVDELYKGDRLKSIRATGSAVAEVIDYLNKRGALQAVEAAVYDGNVVPLPSSMVKSRGADRVVAAQAELTARYLMDQVTKDATTEAFRELWGSIDSIKDSADLWKFRRAVNGFPMAGDNRNGASLHPYSKQRLLVTAEEEAERKGIA